MGIDRQRIVDPFYPPGSEVATHFTPCAIPIACMGDDWYDFDVEGARRCWPRPASPMGSTTILDYRDVVRGYLPSPRRGQDIQAQLKDNLNIDVSIEVKESGAFLDNATAGALYGLYLLGWGADYPDHQLPGLPLRRRREPAVRELPSRRSFVDHRRLDADRKQNGRLREANNAIRRTVPMVPIVHGASATAWQADVEGRSHRWATSRSRR